jgi:hypothetical protein
LEDLALGGRIILNGTSRSGIGHGLVDLARNGDKWWAFVNAIMIFRVKLNEGNFLTN